MKRGKSARGKLSKFASVQIASRLPERDIAKARELGTRKGTGYQTLLRMPIHEGLRREARRA
jgi:predicted DNA binding CopG/RHH family protein